MNRQELLTLKQLNSETTGPAEKVVILLILNIFLRVEIVLNVKLKYVNMTSQIVQNSPILFLETHCFFF